MQIPNKDKLKRQTDVKIKYLIIKAWKDSLKNIYFRSRKYNLV